MIHDLNLSLSGSPKFAISWDDETGAITGGEWASEIILPALSDLSKFAHMVEENVYTDHRRVSKVVIKDPLHDPHDFLAALAVIDYLHWYTQLPPSLVGIKIRWIQIPKSAADLAEEQAGHLVLY